MKEKTLITLSSEILAKIDNAGGARISRSAFIERVLRHYFRKQARKKIHARDLERIDAAAAECLNSEADDVLRYQALVDHR